MIEKDVTIIGSGPAGLTAAIYTSRANTKPLVIDGPQPGGQLMITTEVENYPGFPDGIQGPELMNLMRRQAQRFGTEFLSESVNKVNFLSRPFKIITDQNEILTKSVIIASGASAKQLGLESEKRLMGRGVSACATCDGFFFRGKEVIVVGGGDTAMEEAFFLTRFCSKIYLVHRRDHFRASKIMQQRVMKSNKIEIIWNSGIEEILGEKTVSGVILKNLKTKEEKQMKIDGVFVAIGHLPNTHVFQGQLELNQNGYIIPREEVYTNLTGVFVGGDAQDYKYRQAVSAAGSGCMAALACEKYLEGLGH